MRVWKHVRSACATLCQHEIERRERLGQPKEHALKPGTHEPKIRETGTRVNGREDLPTAIDGMGPFFKCSGERCLCYAPTVCCNDHNLKAFAWDRASAEFPFSSNERHPGRAHFMGICGVGMAGLARLMADRGWQVDGCDLAPDPAMLSWLQNAGIAVRIGHDASHLAPELDLLVVSTAISADMPERAAAERAGVPVMPRGHVLASLVGRSRGIAVCGTHGKTSSAVALTRLLRDLGLDAGWCVGGWSAALDGVSGTGTSDLLVAEADESDGTLAFYRPAFTLLTNVDFDHAEHFENLSALETCFAEVAAATHERLIYCADDTGAKRIASRHPGALGYGVDHAGADVQARAIRIRPDGFVFDVWLGNRRLGTTRLNVPGMHNLRNAMGVVAVALALGQSPSKILSLLARAYQLPKRRFECYAAKGGIRVYADYAHHPREITAMLSMAKPRAKRVCVLFQPHRYSRTHALGADFPPAFNGVDALTVLPVYAASEKPRSSGRAEDLYACFRDAGFANPGPNVAGAGPHGCATVRLAGSMESAWAGMRRRLRRGDWLLVAGAGNVLQVAEWAGKAVASGLAGQRTPVSADPALPWREAVRCLRENGFRGRLSSGAGLGRVTGYGCGGGSDGLAEPIDLEDLQCLFEVATRIALPWRVMGQGRNLCIADDGVPGVVIRLRHAAWRDFQVDGNRVWAGAGWPGAALLARLRALGLGGLAFMTGIPGTLGGWLAMNAGAHGQAIGDRVERIHRLTPLGGNDKLPGWACGWGYRRCEALRHGVALGAWLRLKTDSPDTVAREMNACRKRRMPLGGLRSCGSVFLNPPEDSAGRLIDLCGLRGATIGGARVWRQHANILVADPAATASDVRALMLRMRSAVEARFGIGLESEVKYWEGLAETSPESGT